MGVGNEVSGPRFPFAPEAWAPRGFHAASAVLRVLLKPLRGLVVVDMKRGAQRAGDAFLSFRTASVCFLPGLVSRAW